MEGSEHYVGMVCAFGGFGALIGFVVSALVMLLMENDRRN